MMERRIFEAGEQVSTPAGRGTVYKQLARAAGSVKVAWKEEQFDRTPYSVRLDRDGRYVMALGGEMDAL